MRIRLSGSDDREVTITDWVGEPNQQALAADFDGDGLADPAVYEPVTGKWSLRLSASNYELTTMTVAPGGVPVW